MNIAKLQEHESLRPKKEGGVTRASDSEPLKKEEKNAGKATPTPSVRSLGLR